MSIAEEFVFKDMSIRVVTVDDPRIYPNINLCSAMVGIEEDKYFIYISDKARSLLSNDSFEVALLFGVIKINIYSHITHISSLTLEPLIRKIVGERSFNKYLKELGRDIY